MRIERVFCDICGKELQHSTHPESKLPRFFHVEYEAPCKGEGKAIEPAVFKKCIEKYDFCLECLKEVIHSIEIKKSDRFKPPKI